MGTCGFRRTFALVLVAWLPLAAQEGGAPLRISVVEGEGASYAPGGRATRGVTVEVGDETGNPVAGATVTFHLPGTGASGEFIGGSRSESVATGTEGRASVWGVQWNKTPGPVEITITAAKGQLRAATVAHVTLSNAVSPPRVSTSGAGGGHKLLWILLLAGGGAGGGVVAMLAAKSGSASATSSGNAAVNAPLIGTPTIVIGHP